MAIKHRKKIKEYCTPLTGGGVCLPLSNKPACAVVDASDCKKLRKHRWHEHGGYVCRTLGSGRKAKRECVHRLLLNPKDSATVVDHIDGDPMNNRRNNLRLASKQLNSANIGPLKTNKSGVKGVVKRGSRHRAYIHHNKKTIFLGSFGSKEEAGCAYDKKAKELFGEHARLNGLCVPTT